MKVTNITDIDRFFEVVGMCKGRVELVTEDGNRLNLKSKFCQYVSLIKVFSDGYIKEVELIISDPDDLAKLIDYLILG